LFTKKKEKQEKQRKKINYLQIKYQIQHGAKVKVDIYKYQRMHDLIKQKFE